MSEIIYGQYESTLTCVQCHGGSDSKKGDVEMVSPDPDIKAITIHRVCWLMLLHEKGLL